MTCARPGCKGIFSRFIRMEIEAGVSLMRVGCGQCPKEFSFPTQARLAIVENRILETIKAAKKISASDLQERAECARGYMVRVLARFVRDGLVDRPARGVYAWPKA